MKYKKQITTSAALLILALPFVFRPYVVTGGSMEPTYSEGTVVIAEKLTHHFYVSRGSVLVMRNPHDKKVTEIKRVVGLPGELVEMDSNGVTVTTEKAKGAPWQCQGRPLACSRTYATGTLIGGEFNGPFRIKLGPEDYFVLGDNRSKSSDSRVFGAVQAGDIIGHVIMEM